MRNGELDEFDRKILRALQEDASQPTAEIADKAGLSQPPCWKRIKRLEKGGYIERRIAVLNRKKLGLDVLAIVKVELGEAGRGRLEKVEAKIANAPEVLSCYLVLGESDFVLTVCVKNMDELERFLKSHLYSMEGIRRLRTSVVVGELKSQPGTYMI